jgi:hypothetical protein
MDFVVQSRRRQLPNIQQQKILRPAIYLIVPMCIDPLENTILI